MVEQIREFIDKVPWNIVLIAGLAYSGYDYYQLENAPDSELVLKRAKLAEQIESKAKMEKKVSELKVFSQTLEVKKSEIRQLAADLEGLRAGLTEETDIASFMRMAVTESKKTGMEVTSLIPKQTSKKELVVEQDFAIKFKGAYGQVFQFLDRISKNRNVIQVKDMNMTLIGRNSDKYVLLQGDVALSAYYYVAGSSIGADINTSTNMDNGVKR